MILASELIESIAAKLNAIPDLVALMGGAKARIWAYTDVYPEQDSLASAIANMKAGEILVAWNGVRMATAPGGYWIHDIQVCIRAQEEDSAPAARSYYEAIRLIFEGVPTGGTCRMNQISFLPYMDPMQDMAAERLIDETGADYFEARFTLLETTA